MDTTNPKPSPFFTLPAELRNTIYDILITENYIEADKSNYLDHWDDIDPTWNDDRDDSDNSIGPIRVPRESRSAICQLRSANVNRQWRAEFLARYHGPRILKLYLDSHANYFGYNCDTYYRLNMSRAAGAWSRSTNEWLEIFGKLRVPLHREVWIGVGDFEFKLKITSDGDVEAKVEPTDKGVYYKENSMILRLLLAGAKKLAERCRVVAQSLLDVAGNGLFSLELIGAIAWEVTGDSYHWARSSDAVGEGVDDPYCLLVDSFAGLYRLSQPQ
jgi:hypothetical protein